MENIGSQLLRHSLSFSVGLFSLGNNSEFSRLLVKKHVNESNQTNTSLSKQHRMVAQLLAAFVFISATQVKIAECTFQMQDGMNSLDCMQDQTPSVIWGYTGHDLILPCKARCQFLAMSTAERQNNNFFWSIVTDFGTRAGDEKEHNIMNLFKGKLGYNKNATLDQKTRYSIFETRDNLHGNLKISQLSLVDNQMFLCQYGPTGTLYQGKILKVSVASKKTQGHLTSNSICSIKLILEVLLLAFTLSNLLLRVISCPDICVW